MAKINKQYIKLKAIQCDRCSCWITHDQPAIAGKHKMKGTKIVFEAYCLMCAEILGLYKGVK